MVDGPGEYVVVDMTAGADSFASGLFIRFDITFVDHVRATERGEIRPIDQLEDRNRRALEAMRDRADATDRQVHGDRRRHHGEGATERPGRSRSLGLCVESA